MTPQQLNEQRKIKNLTIEQLADKLGITKRTIYRYLSGSHKIPKKIALAMQVI
jgi:transcriptional regulator with XRE-family HTH domain